MILKPDWALMPPNITFPKVPDRLLASMAQRLRLKVFGVYTPTYQYGFYRNTYGITAGYDFTDRLEMEVGIQNYYNPEKGWNVVPIVIPRYKFKKFDIGIDVGGLLYETIRK